MKIGLYAGTFDPIHRGHLAFAKAGLDAAYLDRIVLVAEKEPYRKKPVASWDHRQAMIARATSDIERVDHDYKFAAELAHQHTMHNMLEVAIKHYGEDSEIWFLVGSDVFEHMHKWQDLIAEAEYGGFVVALRYDHTRAWLDSRLQELADCGFKPKVRLVNNDYPYTGSGQIRSSALAGAIDLKDLPKPVAEYIFAHNLYQS